MDIENTAIRLKRIMEIRNLKQVDLLELVKPYCEKYNVKMNKSDISQYLSGKTKPNQDKLVILSMALNVSESWLIGYDVPMDRINTVNKLDVTQNELILLENYNKLDKEDKNKVVDYTKLLSNQDKYKVLNTTSDEISASNSNVIELNTDKKNDNEEVFIPYQSLDEVGTTIAAHYDDLTEEEKKNADQAILDYINKKNLKDFNKKHNK